MLTDDERTRIRQEETYRQEVQLALNPPKGRVARWLAFASSPFLLWLLSSIVAACITYYVGYREERAAHDTLVDRLSIELVTRLDRMSLVVEGVYTFTTPARAFLTTPSTYPEFAELDILSLVTMFRYECNDISSLGDELYEHARSLIEVGSRSGPPGGAAGAETAAQAILGASPLVRELKVTCRQ